MMKKKFCTGKVGKVSFLGAALFSAMCMFSATVFAGPGDDDDNTGGAATETTEASLPRPNSMMPPAVNQPTINVDSDTFFNGSDFEDFEQYCNGQSVPNQATMPNASNSQHQGPPSAMPSVPPNVTSQMPNFNDSGNDSLDHLFFHVSDYEDDLFLDDSASIEFEEFSNAGGNSALDLPADHDELSDNSSVAIQQPAHRKHGDQWDSCGTWEAKHVVLKLGKFLQYSRLVDADRKAKIISLAGAYLSCPELRVPTKDWNNSSHIYEKLCRNPELLQKLQTLIGNTDFKNYASQYKDKRIPAVTSNTVLTGAGNKLRHDLWHFAWCADLIPASVKMDNITKELSMKICSFVLQTDRFTRDEMRVKTVLLNNMATKHRDAFDAFFRDPNLRDNCAQWCRDNGYVQKPRGRKF